MKVYVLTVKKEQNDNKTYIYGVYSTRGKAVEEAHSLPPCFVNITEFEVDGDSGFIHTIVY